MVNVYLQCGRPGFNPWIRKIPWRKKWQPTLVLLPGKFHGWKSLVGCSPWGCKESDTTERFHFHLNGDIGCPTLKLPSAFLLCSQSSVSLLQPRKLLSVSPQALPRSLWPIFSSFFPFSVILCHSFLLCPA